MLFYPRKTTGTSFNSSDTNFRKQRWKRQQPQAILTFFVYPKFLSFLLFPMWNFACCTCTSMILYMSFDRFLLAVDSRDLFQADKKNIRVFSFSILQNFNFWMIKFTVIQKTLFGTWQFDFIIQKFAILKSKHFSQFFWWEVNLRGLRAFILQKIQASDIERQKKKFCYPSLSMGKEDTAWDRSRDSKAKRNLSKDM